LVHPSKANASATVAGGVAIEPFPGPAPKALVNELASWLKAPFDPPLWGKGEGRAAAPESPKEEKKRVKENIPEEDRPARASVRLILDKIQMGDPGEALALMDGAKGQPNLQPSDRAELAILYKKLGKDDEARRLVEGLDSPPLSHVAAIIRGEQLASNQIVDSVDEKNACQVVVVAWAYATLGQAGQAMGLLENVLVVDKKCARAFLDLADLYLHNRKPRKSIDLLSGALAEGIGDPGSIRMMLASAHRQVGELDRAIELVESVVYDGKGTDDHVRLLITMYLSQQQERESIVRWKERSLVAPADPIPKMMVGILLHYRDEFEESEAWLAPVEEIYAGNPRYQVYRAMNAFNLGSPARARVILDKAAQLPVIDPDVYYCRGELLRDTERPQAIKDFQRYLALTESSPILLPEKQGRVRDQIARLKACEAEGVQTCEGPWEHPRGGFTRYLGLHTREITWVFGILVLLLAGFIFWRRRRSGRPAPPP